MLEMENCVKILNNCCEQCATVAAKRAEKRIAELHIPRPSPRFRSEEYFIYETSDEICYPNL